MKVHGIVIHHTATRADVTKEEIERYHVDVRGWQMIGYHYLVHPNGTAERGRPETMEGAHCRENGRNHTHIGIAVAGNYEEDELPATAFDALANLAASILYRHRLGTSTMTYHQAEKPSTACPGKHIIERWDELVREVESRLPIPGRA